MIGIHDGDIESVHEVGATTNILGRSSSEMLYNKFERFILVKNWKMCDDQDYDSHDAVQT